MTTQLKNAKIFLGKDDYMHFHLVVLGDPVTKGFDKEPVPAIKVWNEKISYVECGEDIYEFVNKEWRLV